MTQKEAERHRKIKKYAERHRRKQEDKEKYRKLKKKMAPGGDGKTQEETET